MPTYKIKRKNPRTGFREITTYQGTLAEKPKGWVIIQRI